MQKKLDLSSGYTLSSLSFLKHLLSSSSLEKNVKAINIAFMPRGHAPDFFAWLYSCVERHNREKDLLM